MSTATNAPLQYSAGYLANREHVLFKEHTFDGRGRPCFLLHEMLPPLLMSEDDSWAAYKKWKITELTELHLATARSFWDKPTPIVLRLLRRLGMTRAIAFIQNFLTIDMRLRLVRDCTFEDLIDGASGLTISHLFDFLQFVNFELKLQLILHLPQRRLRQLIGLLVDKGYAPFVARMADSAPDSFFVETYSQLSEDTCRKILPYIQRPERFGIARTLAASIDNLPRAIVELMHREEQLKLTNERLGRAIAEAEAQRSAALTAAQQLDHLLKQQESLNKRIQTYVPGQLVAFLLGHQDEQRKHRRKKLTVFFSDICGFTETAERLEPESMAQLLNNYLDEMVAIATRHGATIDKFIGDAIVIFFGDPISAGEQNDALACVRMAIEMRDRMVLLRDRWADAGIENPLHVRMGITSGYCTVGDFGSELRRDYTIIGSEVNLAARLQSQALPDTILVSHGTYSLVKGDFEVKERAEIVPKGFHRPVKTYEVVGPCGQAQASISESAPGFALQVDPARLDEAQRRNAIVLLDRAKELLATSREKDSPK